MSESSVDNQSMDETSNEIDTNESTHLIPSTSGQVESPQNEVKENKDIGTVPTVVTETSEETPSTSSSNARKSSHDKTEEAPPSEPIKKIPEKKSKRAKSSEKRTKLKDGKITKPKPRLKKKLQMLSQGGLLDLDELRELKKYNTNFYNPNVNAPTNRKRIVVVDGNDVACSHALGKEFSVKGLEICLDYFKQMGHPVKAVVPQYCLQRHRSTDPDGLRELEADGKLIFTPCKNFPGNSSSCSDDRLILQLAAELDAAVISNDTFRDLVDESSVFKKIIENRVIGYTWYNNTFILPKDPYGRIGPKLNTILNRF